VKRILVCAVMAGALIGAAWGQTPAPLTPEQELDKALTDAASTPLGNVTVGDVQALMMRVSLAAQKVAYVQRAGIASLMVPGAGQFMTGNPGSGALFATGGLAVFAGTLIGAYYLLPPSVQFDKLDYLGAPISTLKSAWKANSIEAYLPSIGVMAGGMIVRLVLGTFAARDAVQDARKNVAAGKVTFRPSLGMWSGMMGMGMGLRMSY
jgi:TM2 domain-containing membrane protein YozV